MRTPRNYSEASEVCLVRDTFAWWQRGGRGEGFMEKRERCGARDCAPGRPEKGPQMSQMSAIYKGIMPRKASNWAEIRNSQDERGESPMQGEGECNGRFGVSQREQAAQVVSWCQKNCNQKAQGFPNKLRKGPWRKRGNNCTTAIQKSDATRQRRQLSRTCPSSSDLALWALL